jgi:uncharacterized protein YecA (UPF0149 family)
MSMGVRVLRRHDSEFEYVFFHKTLDEPCASISEHGFELLVDEIDRQKKEFVGVHGNDFCPCGSGKRYKNCHHKIKVKL